MQAQDIRDGFGPGTRITTADGDLPVDWLAPGDRVITRGHGVQPLRWVGRVRLTAQALSAEPRLRPVQVPGAEGPLMLAPAHRVLVRGAALQLHLGLSAALAAASTVAEPAPECLSRAGYIYHLLLFDAHEVVLADGRWCETHFADHESAALAGMAGEVPPQVTHDRSAYPVLTGGEARLVLGPKAAPGEQRAARAA